MSQSQAFTPKKLFQNLSDCNMPYVMTLQMVPKGNKLSQPDLGPFGLGLCLSHCIPNPNLVCIAMSFVGTWRHCHSGKSEPFNLNQTAPVSPKPSTIYFT